MKLNLLSANFSLFFATIVWGSTFLVIKKSLQGVHAVALNCYRLTFAALAMGIFLLFLRKKPWQHLKAGVVMGTILFCAYILQALAIYDMMVIDAGFISGLFVIFVPIFSFFCGREKLHWNMFLAIFLAMIGLWSVTGGIHGFNKGSFLMLLSAIFFAIYVLYADLVVKRCDVWVLNFQQFSVVAIYSFLAILFLNLPFAIASPKILGWILYLAFLANVLGGLIQLWVQRIISPTVCVLIVSLQPIFAAIFAWTLGGEKIILADIIGGTMIIMAIIVAQIFPRDIKRN